MLFASFWMVAIIRPLSAAPESVGVSLLTLPRELALVARYMFAYTCFAWHSVRKNRFPPLACARGESWEAYLLGFSRANGGGLCYAGLPRA